MNATPPEAKTEYSRGSRISGGRSARNFARRPGPGAAAGGAIGAAILGGTLLGAILLLVAEFTTLFEVRSAGSSTVIKSVGTGSHHTFALVPIALLAAVLAYGVWSAGSRPALLAIGLLGVISLLIALLADLPDAQATGLIGSAATHFTSASSSPSAGLYMETLGAVVLIITSVSGFLLIGSPTPPPQSRTPARLSGS
jgi:hypothetical protein